MTHPLVFESAGFKYFQETDVRLAGTVTDKSKMKSKRLCKRHDREVCFPCNKKLYGIRCHVCTDTKYPCKKCKARNEEKLYHVVTSRYREITTYGQNISGKDMQGVRWICAVREVTRISD